jgi:hypothetical protein
VTQTKNDNLAPPVKPWRRWLKRLALTCVIITILAVAVVVYLSRPARLAALSARLITQITGADVRIGSARISLDGTVRLTAVSLAVPDLPQGAQKLFEAQSVVLEQDLGSLLHGKFVAKRLIVDEPTIFMTEDLATGKFNYQLLQERRAPEGAQGQPPEMPDSLPQVELISGQARFGAVDGGKYRLIGAMNVSGTFAADPTQTGLYLFKFKQEPDSQPTFAAPAAPQAKKITGNTTIIPGSLPGSASPPGTAPPATTLPTDESQGFVIHGKFDLQRVALWATLDKFSFGSVHGNFLPSRLRQAWAQLEPSGAFPSVTFGYDPSAKVAFKSEFELRDFQLTLPVEPLRPRLTNVRGKVTVLNDRISVQGLSGMLEQVPFWIDGQIEGFSTDSPFKLSARAGPLVFKENPAFAVVMPDDVKKIFRRFAPAGRYETTVLVERKELAGNIDYTGVVDIRDAAARFIKFPYQLDKVHGQIRFTPGNVEIVSVTGTGPTGARMNIRGKIFPLTDDPNVQVTVAAADFPLDDFLRQAMPPRRRLFLDVFFNAPAAARLAEMDLVQTASVRDKRAEELSALRTTARNVGKDAVPDEATQRAIDRLRSLVDLPVFEPGGRAAFNVQINHEFGPNSDYLITTDLDMTGLNLMFKAWPYPLRVERGRLRVEPDRAVLEDLVAVGPHGGRLRLAGTVDLPNDGSVVPHLKISVTGLPIDELLLASVPAPQDQWLRQIKLVGNLDATGDIFLDPAADQIDFKVAFTTAGASAKPFAGGYPLTDVKGQVTLSRGKLAIDSLSARHKGSTLALDGLLAFTGPTQGFNLNIIGKALRVEDQTLDLVPQGVAQQSVEAARKIIVDHRLTGVFDLSCKVRQSEESPADVTITIKPSQVAGLYRGNPVAMSQMTGSIIATPGKLALDKLTAVVGNTTVGATGSVTLASEQTIELAFDAAAPSLEPDIEKHLPDNVRSVIRGLEAQGSYSISNGKLVYRTRAISAASTTTQPAASTSPATNDAPRYDLQAQIKLRDASAKIGVPITNLDGMLNVALVDQPGPYPRMSLKLDAQTLRASRRIVSPLKLSIVSAPNLETLVIDRVQGGVYEGVLTGAGQIALVDGRYRMELALHDTALTPFIQPDPPSPGEPAEQLPTGFVSASLSIEGVPGQSDSRRGRGAMLVRDAKLYNWPLTLALLQIVNLAIPEASAFKRANASYILDGDLIHVDSVRLTAPTVEIFGSGSIRFDTHDMDLTLHARNPNGLKLGPITDIFGLLRDQLLTIVVDGTLEKPRASLRSFDSARRAVLPRSSQTSPATPQTQPVTTQPTNQ